jgi:hypothetical protein
MAPRFNQIKYYSGGGAPRTLSGPNVKIPKFVEPKIPPGAGAQAVQGLSKVAAAFFKADKDKKDKAAKRADEDAATRMIEALTTRFDPTKYGASPQTLMAAAEEMPEGEEDDAWAAPSPEEQREFYTDQANKTQSDYGSTYGAGLVRANQARGDYNTQDNRDWLAKLRDVDEPKGMGPESRSTMRNILLGDKSRRDAKEAAELKRSRDMEEYIKQQQNKAFAPQGEKRTKEYKNAISMGLTPGTKEFNDYMRRATKITPDEPNPLLTKHAEALSETFDDWGKKGRAAPGFLAKLGDLRGVLKSGVDQGFGQKFLNKAAALSTRMGWKINMQNLTGAEVADSLINQLVVPRVKDLGAKPTDKDLQFIIDIFPKITNQPGSNELILQVLEIDSKRNIARAGFISKWLKENAKTDRYGLDFQPDLQAFENSNDIFKKFVPPGWVPREKGGAGDTKVGAGDTIVKITSDEEYDSLKSGQEFIGPDGKKRKKP